VPAIVTARAATRAGQGRNIDVALNRGGVRQTGQNLHRGRRPGVIQRGVVPAGLKTMSAGAGRAPGTAADAPAGARQHHGRIVRPQGESEILPR